MLDYGKACSDDFNYNESAFENQAYYNTDDVSQYIEAYSLLNSESANGKFKSYAYIAKSVPALRIYLNTTEAEAVALGGKAIVDGETYDHNFEAVESLLKAIGSPLSKQGFKDHFQKNQITPLYLLSMIVVHCLQKSDVHLDIF